MNWVSKGASAFTLGALTLSLGCGAASESGTDGQVGKVEGALTAETYGGGAVLSNVEVVVVFWGNNVSPTIAQSIGPFYAAMTNNPYMDSIREYSTPSQLIGRGALINVTTITPSNPSTTLDDSAIQNELVAQVDAGKLPAPNANTYYAIHFPPNMNITANFAGCGVLCQASTGCHEGFQSGGRTFRFGLLPDCGSGFASVTSVASHELMETVTDPDTQNTRENLKSGWLPEIGDSCNGQNASMITPGGGTYTVQKINSNRAGGCIASAPLNDFNVDNKEDLVWHNGTTGDTQAWYMNGPTRLGFGALAPTANLADSSGWKLVGLADFNVDGSTDLLWHNANGAMVVYYMNGGSRTTIGAFDGSLTVPDSTGWHIVSTNDFNSDGRPDILWHNGSTGSTSVWYMNGTTRTGVATFATSLNVSDSTGWVIAGTNDFNSDGYPDLVWHNGSTGSTSVWYMSGISRIGVATLDASLNVGDSSGWKIVSTNDFNSDGYPDLVWHNGSTGSTQIWYMNGISRIGIANLDASLNVGDSSGWKIVNR